MSRQFPEIYWSGVNQGPSRRHRKKRVCKIARYQIYTLLYNTGVQHVTPHDTSNPSHLNPISQPPTPSSGPTPNPSTSVLPPKQGRIDFLGYDLSLMVVTHCHIRTSRWKPPLFDYHTYEVSVQRDDNSVRGSIDVHIYLHSYFAQMPNVTA